MARLFKKIVGMHRSTSALRRRNTQLQIKFQRVKTRSGKYRTIAKIERGERQYHGSNRGLLHKAVHLKYRVVGDRPSITKSLNSLQPKSVKGMAVRNTARIINFTAHDTLQTAVDVGLAAETAFIKAKDAAQRETIRYVQNKYRQNAVDDYHKGTLFMARLVIDAAKGTYQHFRLKKQHKVERFKFKEKKHDNLRFRKSSKLKKRRNKLQRKINKAKYQKQKQGFKRVSRRSKSYAVSKYKFKRRKQQYRQTAKEIKLQAKNLKTEKKNRSRELKVQRKISRNTKAGFLALKPIRYGADRMKSSAWQKAVYDDNDNDMLRAVDEVKRHVVDPAARKVSRQSRLQQQEKKRDKLKSKEGKSNTRLHRQEEKLKKKRSSKPKYRKGRPIGAPPPTFSERIKDIFKSAGKFLKNVYEHEVKKFFGSVLLPILLIALILVFIIMIFSSVFSGGGFVLGTYNAQDYDLSEAEKYYTQLAKDLNQKVLNVGDESNWKSGLSSLGADTSGMNDKPTNWYWGYSDVLPYTPVYDFDCYELWSFLCAYYYDFSTSNDDVKYWEYDSGTESVLKALFDDEYEFLYHYDNGSRWEELSNYVYFGGGSSASGGYYTCESTAYKAEGVWTYKFKPTAYTSELGQYLDGDGYCYIDSSYRVLNANDGCKPTGYYILDNRYFADSAHSVAPFYWFDSSRNAFYFRNCDGAYQDRSFYGWGDDDAWFMITPSDTRAWLGSDEDMALFGYVQKLEWIEDCSLYYTVRQKKTFDEAVEDKLKSMEYANERWEYYKLLAGLDGSSLYGNHQTLHNVVSGNSIISYVNDGYILNGYGYDMQNWGEKHCNITDLHDGIDIILNSGSEIYAPFGGKIKEYDSSNHTVILRKDDIQYWYDGNGGTKRDTEVTICNITLASGYSEGDTVKEGEVFAYSTSSKKCDDLSNDIGIDYIHVKVEIDTDGWGWDFIDPRLVLY